MRTRIKKARALAKKHVDSKQLFRLRLFLAILAVMTALVVYDLLVGAIGLPLAVVAILAGTVAGVVSSRMTKLTWNEETSQIVGRMDAVGTVVLVAYIALAVARNWVVKQWFEGPVILAITFCFVAGIMAGRLYGMQAGIVKILTGKGIMEVRRKP